MRKNKITMVNPEQIVARGWKGMKTRKGVENFTIKQKVNHVYWRAPGNKKVLLVDFNHFQESWREWKKEFRTTIFRPGAQKPKPTRSYYSQPTSRKPYARKKSTYKRTTRRY